MLMLIRLKMNEKNKIKVFYSVHILIIDKLYN